MSCCSSIKGSSLWQNPFICVRELRSAQNMDLANRIARFMQGEERHTVFYADGKARNWKELTATIAHVRVITTLGHEEQQRVLRAIMTRLVDEDGLLSHMKFSAVANASELLESPEVIPEGYKAVVLRMIYIAAGEVLDTLSASRFDTTVVVQLCPLLVEHVHPRPPKASFSAARQFFSEAEDGAH